ncbi:retrovirus-related pol polyprotein from transposon TNT 1-94 [Tanacetum coccineum]
MCVRHLLMERKDTSRHVHDYSRFTWVKCLRSSKEAPDFIIKFLKMIQYYEKVGISHETSVARSLQQNGVVERPNRTLIEASCIMLIYAKASLFLRAEAVATACYTQRTCTHFLSDKRKREHWIFDELSVMSSLNTAVQDPTPEIHPSKISSWDSSQTLLLQHFAPEPAASTDSPSSTTVDQDAPSPSNSPKPTPETQSPIISNDVEEDNHNLDVAHMNNDPYFIIPIPEVPF